MPIIPVGLPDLRSLKTYIALRTNEKSALETRRLRAIDHSLRDIIMALCLKLVAIDSITLGRLLMTDKSKFTKEGRKYLDEQIAHHQLELSTQWNCYLLEKKLYAEQEFNA